MAYDEEDDLFVDDFDFVDEEDETAEQKPEKSAEAVEEEPEEKKPARPKRRTSSRSGKQGPKQKAERGDPSEAKETAEDKGAAEKKETPLVEEPKEPEIPTDHVVHLYEYGKFTRTINREFTSDDAETFVVEFNRTSSAHSRHSVVAGKDDKPAEAL